MKDKESIHENAKKNISSKLNKFKYKKYDESKKPQFPPIKYEKPPHH